MDIWGIGKTHNIELMDIYDLSSDPTNPTILPYIKIELSIDNKSSWLTIAANYHNTTGLYSWVVPNSPSSTCYIRISDPNDSNNSGDSKLFGIGATENTNSDVILICNSSINANIFNSSNKIINVNDKTVVYVTSENKLNLSYFYLSPKSIPYIMANGVTIQ